GRLTRGAGAPAATGGTTAVGAAPACAAGAGRTRVFSTSGTAPTGPPYGTVGVPASIAAKAAAEGGRSAGSFASAPMHASTIARGASGASAARSGGDSFTCAAATATGVGATNGGRPASIS